MSDSFKMKKLIQQQINSGSLNSFFNKGQVNNLNVGRAGQNSLNVIGNENVDGLFVADKIGINTSNPTKPFEVNSCTIFEGKISVSVSTSTAPYTSTVTGTNTKFKKIFNLNDLIIFPNASNIEIYCIINAAVSSNTSLDIELADELIAPIDNVNYQGFYINPGTIDINSDPLNLKKVVGTNTLFNSYFKNGDKFVTINNGKLEIQNVNNIISDTELFVSGNFSTTTSATGLANYCAVIYDIIDDYGNMGLGTYNPTEKLDVDGNINVSGHIYNNGVIVEVSPWLNSIVPATPPYTQNIYYDLGYVGIGDVSSNPAYLLDVYGSARFQDTIIDSTTDSTDITTGALTTTGGVGITLNLNVGGTFTVTGIASADGGITVPTGQSVLINGDSTLTVGTGATTLGGNLIISGLTSADGGITVPTGQSVLINGTSTLTVGTGATTLGGTLTTTGLTSADGGITVPTGQTVALNGTTSLTVGGTLTVSGLTSANGGLTVPTAQSVAINGTSTLTVGTGATILGGTLTVTGLTSTNGGISVPTAQSVVLNGTTILTVGTGATTLGGTLTTTGLTSTNGGITVPTGQSVLINGNSTLTVGTGATILGGILTTTGLTSANGGLTVTGLTTSNGGITVPTGQTVTINGASTLTVGTGATILGGALTTTGLTTANGGLTVSGLTTSNGGITVPTGQAVAINGTSTLTVGTGATNLGGVLNVTSALTTLSNGLTVSGTNGISLNSTTNTINIGDGANNNNINIGTSGVRTLTVGNNTAGTKVNITTGTTNTTDGVVITGNTYLNNKYVNYIDITSLPDTDYTPSSAILFVNGYFFQSVALTAGRNFTIPTAANIVAAINNCIVGSYFTFTINNKAGAANDRTIVAGAGITITNLISPIIPGGSSLVFICRITNIGSGTEAAELYDTVA